MKGKARRKHRDYYYMTIDQNNPGRNWNVSVVGWNGSELNYKGLSEYIGGLSKNSRSNNFIKAKKIA